MLVHIGSNGTCNLCNLLLLTPFAHNWLHWRSKWKLQMLSQLGMCSSRNTLLRLKTAVLSQRRRDGMHKNVATSALSVTSTIVIVLHWVNALHLETKAESSMERVFSTFPYATHLHLEGKWSTFSSTKFRSMCRTVLNVIQHSRQSYLGWSSYSKKV